MGGQPDRGVPRLGGGDRAIGEADGASDRCSGTLSGPDLWRAAEREATRDHRHPDAE